MENGVKTDRDKPVTVNASSPVPADSRSRVLYLGIVFAGMLAAKLFFDLASGVHKTKQPPTVKPAVFSAPAQPESFNVTAPVKNTGTDIDETGLSGLAASAKKTESKTEEKKEPPAPPLLVLNGTFLSEGEEFAIINNQIVKAGDEIEGASVKKITVNAVELEFAGQVLRISSEEN